MPNVFTIICHGTDSHSLRTDGELMSILGRVVEGEEYQQFLILDGPGGKPDSLTDEDLAKVHHPMTGTFDWSTKSRTKKESTRFTSPKKELGDDGSLTGQLSGKMSGAGWDDNVRHAMVVLGELMAESGDRRKELRAVPRPTVVNLIGWSRGAVTTFKIAYEMFDLWPQLAVNIFAVDPVVGGVTWSTPDQAEIRANVKNLIVTLATDEQRNGFKPQDLTRLKISTSTNYAILPFPGRHNTQLRTYVNPKEDEDAINQVARAQEVLNDPAWLVWHLCYRFLKLHGTQFKLSGRTTIRWPKESVDKTFDAYQWLADRTPRECLERYARLTQYRPFYTWFLSNHSGMDRVMTVTDNYVPMRFQRRDFQLPHNIYRYVKHPYYFINEHHRWCFRNVFPKQYPVLFPDFPDGDPLVGRKQSSELEGRPCEIAPSWKKLLGLDDLGTDNFLLMQQSSKKTEVVTSTSISVKAKRNELKAAYEALFTPGGTRKLPAWNTWITSTNPTGFRATRNKIKAVDSAYEAFLAAVSDKSVTARDLLALCTKGDVVKADASLGEMYALAGTLLGKVADEAKKWLGASGRDTSTEARVLAVRDFALKVVGEISRLADAEQHFLHHKVDIDLSDDPTPLVLDPMREPLGGLEVTEEREMKNLTPEPERDPLGGILIGKKERLLDRRKN